MLSSFRRLGAALRFLDSRTLKRHAQTGFLLGSDDILVYLSAALGGHIHRKVLVAVLSTSTTKGRELERKYVVVAAGAQRSVGVGHGDGCRSKKDRKCSEGQTFEDGSSERPT